MQAVDARVERSSFWGSVGPALRTTTAQLHLLVSEGALAFPGNGEWTIRELPTLRSSRKLPNIASTFGDTRALYGSNRHVRVMGELYTFEGFVEVSPEDLVVDVGAFVGGFTRYAAPRARHVIAVEPSAVLFDALSFNTRDYDNVSVVAKAAWNEAGTIELNCSSFPNENSLFDPDTGSDGRSIEVPAEPVPEIVRGLGFDRIDFLKVEAEGAEPEILESTLNGSIPVRKVVVDVTPERGEEPVEDRIIRILEYNDFSWKRKDEFSYWGDQYLFARSDGSE